MTAMIQLICLDCVVLGTTAMIPFVVVSGCSWTMDYHLLSDGLGHRQMENQIRVAPFLLMLLCSLEYPFCSQTTMTSLCVSGGGDHLLKSSLHRMVAVYRVELNRLLLLLGWIRTEALRLHFVP